MSYARWGWGGSDVYVYMHVGGFLTCTWCPLMEDQEELNFDTKSTQVMAAHLKRHELNGERVPNDIYQRLWEDDKENFPRDTKY